MKCLWHEKGKKHTNDTHTAHGKSKQNYYTSKGNDTEIQFPL